MELNNREITWLSFNERVLQEAQDPLNPLIERLRFLGIYSNNLDEFFRVRVATVRRIIDHSESKGEIKKQNAILKEIKKKSLALQTVFDTAFEEIVHELEKHGVYLHTHSLIPSEYEIFLRGYFQEKILRLLFPVFVEKGEEIPQISDEEIYFFVTLRQKDKQLRHAILEVPGELSRFIVIPETDPSKKEIVMLEDVIERYMQDVFSPSRMQVVSSFVFKITRDAELDMDNEHTEGLLSAMKKSLQKRKRGEALRLVFDSKMPKENIKFLSSSLDIDTNEDHLHPGGKYHNFKDFIKFPHLGLNFLNFTPFPPTTPQIYQEKNNYFSIFRKKDRMFQYPYQDYTIFLDWLRQASIDPKVSSIKMFIYRLAEDSKIAPALVNAAKNGKDVMVVIELKARFDETNNINWTKYFRENGVRVLHGFEDVKIHSKLCVIARQEGGKQKLYAAVGTGNFNESTAKIYSDVMLITADPRITKEANNVFNIVIGNFSSFYNRHIVLSPRHLRNRLIRLINQEIKAVKQGGKGEVYIKVNSLSDEKLIEKLYEAHSAGVHLRILVRGICCLRADEKGHSEGLQVRSILDRFLEHSRIFSFYSNGEQKCFISSADWMVRNLDKRIELTIPIYDEDRKKELLDFLEIQWKDNVKARKIEFAMKNKYIRNNKPPFRSQEELYHFFKQVID